MNDQNLSPKLFDEGAGMALAAQSDAAAVARATQEIQAALVIAQRFPRDVVKIKARVMDACKRLELAQDAEYEYSRGGTKITGPTIDLLRAIANRWGNVRFGWTEVERRQGVDGVGVSSVRCFAWDLQTNSQAERTFTVKHWRDVGKGGKDGYAVNEERDIYELMANQAARRVRACLEEVIDSDVVTAAVDQCRATLKTGQKESLPDRMAKMLGFMQPFGVTAAMIESKLGNKLDAVSENQYASLYRIWKALKDGVGQREDYFKPEASKPEFTPAGAPTPPENPPKFDKGDDGDLGPVSNAPASAPAPATKAVSPEGHAYNPLRALRGLIKMSKHKEGELMDFWSGTGATDGSATSLEEVAMSAPELIKSTAEQWKEIDARITELKKKEAR